MGTEAKVVLALKMEEGPQVQERSAPNWKMRAQATPQGLEGAGLA